MDDLGARFWLLFVGALLLAALGGVLIFWFMGMVWYSWGLLGTILFLSAVLIGFGWVIDKREARRRGGVPA